MDTQTIEKQLLAELQKTTQAGLENATQGAQPTQDDGVIDVDAINNAQPIKVPEPVQPGAVPSIDFSQFFGETDEDRQQNDLMNSILGTSEQLGERGTVSNQIGDQLGITEKSTALQTATNRLKGLAAQSQQAPLVIQEEAAGQGQTRFTTQIRGQDAQRQIAIQSIGAMADFEAARGNLETARSLQTEKVNAIFAPLEAQLETQKLAFDMNRDRLDRIDAKKAQALEIQLNERERLLQNAKEEQQKIQQVVLNAQANGADAETILRIQKSQSVDEAIGQGGQFGVDPQTRLAQDNFDRQTQQMNFENQFAIDKFAFDKATDTRDYNLKLNQIRQERADQEAARIKATEVAKQEQLVAQETNAQVQDTVVETIDEKLALIDQLLQNNLGLQGAVGGGGIFEVQGAVGKVSGKQGNWESALAQLINQETFAKLAEITKNTSLGAISEGELKLVASSATQLGGELNKMSETRVIEILSEMSDNLLTAKKKAYSSVVPIETTVEASQVWANN